MKPDELKHISLVFRVTRWLSVLPRLALALLVVASPVIIYKSFNDYNSWDLHSLTRALQGGYFWQDPTGFLFQQSYGDKTLGSWSDYANNTMAFLIVIGIGMVLLFAGLWGIVKGVRTMALSGLPDSTLAMGRPGLLLRFVKARRQKTFNSEGRAFGLTSRRQWAVLSVELGAASPHLVFQSAHGGGRVLPIGLPQATEAVIEGAFLAQYHVYAHPSVFALVPRILRPELMQYFVAAKGVSYVEVLDGQLHVMVRSKLLARPAELQKLLEAIDALVLQLQSSLQSVGTETLKPSLKPTITALQSRSYYVSWATVRGWWFLVVWLALVISLPLQAILLPDGVSGDDEMFQTIFQFIGLAIIAFGPRIKKLRAKQAFWEIDRV